MAKRIEICSIGRLKLGDRFYCTQLTVLNHPHGTYLSGMLMSVCMCMHTCECANHCMSPRACTCHGTHVDIRRQPGVLALTFHLVQDRVSHITFRSYVGSGGSYLITYACTASACIHGSIHFPSAPHRYKEQSLKK